MKDDTLNDLSTETNREEIYNAVLEKSLKNRFNEIYMTGFLHGLLVSAFLCSSIALVYIYITIF
jgi:hypothetical protein